MYKAYQQHLTTLHNSGKYRRLGRIRQGRSSDILDFSTNDYLNLSRNTAVIAAGEAAGQTYGAGSTGSRLLSGNSEIYERFEATVALNKRSESSLIFNSGFQANISTLSCLLDDKVLQAKPLVFFDKLNHSSLYQAVFLSKAELCRYRHNDLNHLDSLLKKHKDDHRPKFIVTETVFGMDGDIAPIAQIVQLAQQHNAFLYLDEAHATGIFGDNGYGLSTNLELQDIPHIIMGTFSKAIGVSGGYIACHSVIRDFIINKATGFIYSTAPSPFTIGAAFKAWQLVGSMDEERAALHKLGTTLRHLLSNNGFNIGTSQTHIVPIILQDEEACLKLQRTLLNGENRQIIVSCIRPPTVPPGSSRLRIALTAKHTLDDIKCLAEAVKAAGSP